MMRESISWRTLLCDLDHLLTIIFMSMLRNVWEYRSFKIRNSQRWRYNVSETLESIFLFVYLVIVVRIRIQLGLRIRIWIRNPYLDPGRPKLSPYWIGSGLRKIPAAVFSESKFEILLFTITFNKALKLDILLNLKVECKNCLFYPLMLFIFYVFNRMLFLNKFTWLLKASLHWTSFPPSLFWVFAVKV